MRNKYEIKTDEIRGPNSKLVINGPEAQNENKHSSPDKIWRLHYHLWPLKNKLVVVREKNSSNLVKLVVLTCI